MNLNIYKYYLYSAISSFLFFLPIVYVFFQENGLSLTQIFIIEAIFSVGLVLFEVPTGAFADYFGKKASLVIGSFIWIISCVLFSFGSGFYMFTFAYLIWALGAAFLSGADTALFYDILHKDNQKEHFKKYQGNAKFIGLVAISTASILGGYIASFSMRYTFIASAIAFFVMFIILISIKHKEDEKEEQETYTQIIKNSFSIIRKSSILIWLFFYSALFMVVFKLTQPSTQIYMNLANLDIKYFGFASAFFFIIAAIASKLTDRFEKKFQKYSYLILSILMILSTFLVSQFVFKLGFLIFGILFFATSINSIIVQHEVLENSPKSKHSTILSFNNLFDRLMFVIISPLWGFGMDKLGLTNTFFYASLITIVFILILMIPFFMRKPQTNNTFN
jgi:MFS family permease